MFFSYVVVVVVVVFVLLVGTFRFYDGNDYESKQQHFGWETLRSPEEQNLMGLKDSNEQRL